MSQPEVQAPRLQRPARDPLPEGHILQSGMYVVGPLVGIGGFSLTYLGYQGPLKLPVAIKEFFPNGCVRAEDLTVQPACQWTQEGFEGTLENFEREGSILARFHHPGIVRVHGQFRENNSAYLVEELLEGETLGEGLARAGVMPLNQALQVAQQVGQALMLVHAGGLVHSDIKPDNLFWTNEGRYVILDFGVSRGYLSEKAAKEGMAAVSPGYSPPEQYDRNSKLEPAADVYALAGTLYHLLVGYPPLDARKRTKGEKLNPIRSVNATVSAEVEAAVFRGLTLEVKKRTPGVRQFMEDLGVDISLKLHAETTQEFIKRSEYLAHPGGTHAVVLHTPSHRLYSAGKDGRICVWAWPELKLLGSLAAHNQAVNALAISPDGGYLVSGCQSGEIRLWDAAKGVAVKTLIGESGPAVMRLAFHPEGGMIAAGFTDGRCAVIGPSLPQPLIWQAHKGSVNAIDISPDGMLMASGADDKSIHLWRMPDGRFLRSLMGHDKLLQSLRFSPDGRLLLSGSNDMSVRLWDVSAQCEMRNLKGHRGMVWDAQFTHLPELIVSISADRCLRAFRVDNGRVVVSSEAHEGWARALAVDLLQPFLATGGADGYVRVWEIPRVL